MNRAKNENPRSAEPNEDLKVKTPKRPKKNSDQTSAYHYTFISRKHRFMILEPSELSLKPTSANDSEIGFGHSQSIAIVTENMETPIK